MATVWGNPPFFFSVKKATFGSNHPFWVKPHPGEKLSKEVLAVYTASCVGSDQQLKAVKKEEIVKEEKLSPPVKREAHHCCNLSAGPTKQANCPVE